MHSPTSLLSELLIVELLLLLHLCSKLCLLHGLLVAHHESDLADLFSLHSQALNKLFTRLLVATETTEPHTIMKRLSTTHTERHCFTNSTKNAVLFHPCSMKLNSVLDLSYQFQLTEVSSINTGQVSNPTAAALSLIESHRGSSTISLGSTP